jgi:hypothetical protein
MTIKQFLNEHTLDAVETVSGRILNIIVNSIPIGLDVNTDDIVSGTPLTRIDNFTINGDILTADSISIDMNSVNVVGFDYEDA